MDTGKARVCCDCLQLMCICVCVSVVKYGHENVFSISTENEQETLNRLKRKSLKSPPNPESCFVPFNQIPCSYPKRNKKLGRCGCWFLLILFLFLVLELICQPIKALIEAVAAGGAGGLDVPVAVAQGV